MTSTDTIDIRSITDILGWEVFDIGDRSAARLMYRRPNGGVQPIDHPPTVGELLAWLQSKGCAWSAGAVNDGARGTQVWFHCAMKFGGGEIMPARNWDSLYEAAVFAVRRVAAHV